MVNFFHAEKTEIWKFRKPLNTGIFYVFSELNMIEVVDFLNKNPKALENYIMESVSREQLERWLIRKIHAQKYDTSEKNREGMQLWTTFF